MDKIDDFVEMLGTPKSKYQTKRVLIRYFDQLGITPTEYLKDKESNYFEDIKSYYRLLKSQGKTPRTLYNSIKPIVRFLEFNYVEFDVQQKKLLKQFTRKNKTLTMDGILTKKELRRILDIAQLHKKAFILFLASSGCRKGEVENLLEEDIDFSHNPTKVIIPALLTKTNRPRVTFITDETTEVLKQWLENKEKWLISARGRASAINKQKNERDRRLFPFSNSLIYYFWVDLLQKTNLDKQDRTTNRYIYHLHTLRKFFITNMKKGMNEAMVHTLTGQESELARTYTRFTVEELAENYKDNQHLVSIYTTGYGENTITELKNTIADLQVAMKKEQEEKSLMREAELLRIQIETGHFSNGWNEERAFNRLDVIKKKLGLRIDD